MIIATAVVGHFLEHKILKILYEDRRDEYGTIARFFGRGMSSGNWDNIGYLPEKREHRRSN
jgi:hypothetical protein